MSLAYTRRKSFFIAGTALLGAVVAVLDLSKMKTPYPPFPILKFDALGIPMLLSYFLFGLLSGTITSLVAWPMISTHDPFFPFSGFMKFLAEFSTIMGVFLVLRFGKPAKGLWKGVSMFSGIALRVIVTSVANVLLLPVFMASFYQTPAAVIVVVPSFAIFNAIQGAISVFGGFLFYEAVILRLPWLKS